MPRSSLHNEIIKNLIKTQDLFGSIYIFILAKHFGNMDFLDFDLDTLLLLFKQDFGVELDIYQQNKLYAALTLMATNSFYVHPETFCVTCNALCGEYPPPSKNGMLFIPPDSDNILWAIVEAEILGVYEPQDFSTDVLTTMGVILQEEGWLKPPVELKFLDSYIKPPSFQEGQVDTIMLEKYLGSQQQLLDGLYDQTEQRLSTWFVQMRQIPDIPSKLLELIGKEKNIKVFTTNLLGSIRSKAELLAKRLNQKYETNH